METYQCGLLNKRTVYSGRSVRDQQPDYPEDNATGSLFPPSVSLAFLLGSTQSSMGISKVELEFLFQALVGMPRHYLSVKTA